MRRCTPPQPPRRLNSIRVLVSEETMDACERGIEDARSRDVRDHAISVLKTALEDPMKR